MKRLVTLNKSCVVFFCIALFLLFSSVAYADTWAKTYGGSADLIATQQTSDGGYIAAGAVHSNALVFKLDPNGSIQWQKAYVGDGYIIYSPHSVRQIADGGYIVSGRLTASGGGQGGGGIVWKLDANGNIQWQKVYGLSYGSGISSLQLTSDGGYIAVGWDLGKIWIFKIDANGNIEWQKIYGNMWEYGANSIQETSDGGYIVAGSTSLGFNQPFSSAFVMKLDSKGDIIWQKAYGGSNDNVANSVQQTSDGGYIVGGNSNSFGPGRSSAWVFKLDSGGNIQWQKSYGGWYVESANSVQQTSDGGYIVMGESRTFGGAVTWIFKLTPNGAIQWEKTYGIGWDLPSSIQQTSDGGYIVGVRANSFHAGGGDAWILKLDTDGNIAGCPAGLIKDSNATIVNTAAIIRDTNAAGQNTTSTPFPGKAVETNANLIIGGVCIQPNQPPVANAGPDQTIQLESCSGITATPVTLDGSASYDLDGDALTYKWTWVGGSAEGVNPTINLPYGKTTVTLAVDDGKGGTSSDTVDISIVDTAVPTLNVTVTPNILWPPNHKYVKVLPSLAVNDACAETTKVEFVSATSNEPDNGLGDGDTDNDIVINADGSILLRAERSGRGDGRIYTITYRATDAAGNSTTASATVTVPHNK